ncbi:MAG: NADP-dependent isocitrate dehydrogenase, partial [Myxococcales bacterium]|nr:NADP-dependent isocitrate dehydrogenase [Myxococcales bacterium]
AFRDWGYALARREYDGSDDDDGGFRMTREGHVVALEDINADAFLQQILTNPGHYAVIATMYQNGDYVSDAISACVGGVGITPGVNHNADDSLAIFEAGHGSAPKYAGRDLANPSALILSGEMMLRRLGWVAAADRVLAGLAATLAAGLVTQDFHRVLEGAGTQLGTAAFADAIIERL